VGARGPEKLYPHSLKLSVDDETWEFLEKMSTILNVNRQDVARVTIRNGIRRLDEVVAKTIEECIEEMREEEK